jgi:hypothetical protein
MDTDKRARAIVKATKELRELGFEGVFITACYVDDSEDTHTMTGFAGNRHAVEGMITEWLREHTSYQNGFEGERGRYDAVVARQHEQNKG